MGIALQIFTVRFAFSLVSVAVLAPLLQSLLGVPVGESLYRALADICHQYPTRSLWVTERPMALCARCFSGYLGLGLAALVLPLSSPYWKHLLAGIILLFIVATDPLVQLLTTYESNNFLRAITGLVGGAALWMIICPADGTRNAAPR